MQFEVCESTGFYLRMGLMGPAGSGKTYTALRIATEFGCHKIGVIDTESKSARRYASSFTKPFLTLELDHFSPKDYITAIEVAQKAGIEFLVVDSLSHAWMGKGGILDMAEAAAKRSNGGNSFTAWREVTPEHNKLVDTLLRVPMHLLVTMRVKTEYVVEKNSKEKLVPRKVGLAPVQREGLDYELDVIGELTSEHELIVTKSRCPLLSGAVLHHPGAELAQQLKLWVSPPQVSDTAARFLKRLSTTRSPAELDMVRDDLAVEVRRGGKFAEGEQERLKVALKAARIQCGGAA